jgi:ubiquitin-protein ligase
MLSEDPRILLIMVKFKIFVLKKQSHFTIFSAFIGGIYQGKLVFPKEFPFKPPSIYMITPNGRFKVNQK